MSCRCNFGAGLSTCHCAGCCRTFTSITAFDMHQRLEGGRIICTDPIFITRRDGSPAMAVIRQTPDDWPVWGQYNPEARQFDSRAEISGPDGATPASSPRAA